jgi:tetratricopeptide (TPR) repeat protein
MKITRALLTLVLAVSGTGLFAQTTPYVPGEFQSSNPYYPKPNPFYFEGKVDWFNLKITTPANFWEFLQRGIHKQDDLGDTAGAIQDYQTALAGNSLTANTCQIVTAASFVNGKLPSTLTPPPCMFTVRLRLAYLLRETDPDQAIALFKEVAQIDPLKLDIDALIAETYLIKAEETTDPVAQNDDYQHAIQYFQAELALSPVTSVVTQQTTDTANNAHVHWELAELYEKLGMDANAVTEYDLYLQATKWHSDVYPWRIALAQTRKQTLKARH